METCQIPTSIGPSQAAMCLPFGDMAMEAREEVGTVKC